MSRIFLARCQHDRMVKWFDVVPENTIYALMAHETKQLYDAAVHSWSLSGVSIEFGSPTLLERFKLLVKGVIGSAYEGRRIAEDQS